MTEHWDIHGEDGVDDLEVGFTDQFTESFVGFDELLAPVLG